MKKIILCSLIAFGLIEGLRAEQLSFLGGGGESSVLFNDTVGYAIMVGSNPIQVVQISDMGVVSHIGIWLTNGTLVAGVTNSPAASGSWNIAPVTLAANTEYILGSVNTSGGHSEMSYGGLNTALNSDVSLVGVARNNNQLVFSIPTVTSGPQYNQMAIVGPTISFNIITASNNINGFIFSTNNNSAAILSYIGSSNVISIPSTLAGLPVTSIGSNAFGNNTNLKSVIIPPGVTNISSSAFSGCSGLTNITIPNSVSTIGTLALSGCTALTYVTIPDSVVSFGTGIFSNSPNVSVNGSQGLVSYLSQNTLALGFGSNALTFIQNGGVAAGSYNLTENWLLNDSNFINTLATIFFVPPVALVSLSNSISTLANQTSPTNNLFVKQIATNPSFIVTLTTNTYFLSSLSSNLVSGSSIYGIATAGQLQSLSSSLSNTSTLLANQGAGFSNAISNSLVTIGGVSNTLANSFNTGQIALSNSLSAVISNKITGLSNSLTSSVSTQISGLSNNITAVATQTTGVSNALTTSISQQGTTLNNAITSISNSISANTLQIASASNALSSTISNLGNSLNNSILANTLQIASASNALSSAISNLASSLSNSITAAAAQTASVSNALVSLAAQTPTTNDAFIRTIAAQIQSASNNYGIAVKQTQSLSFPAIPTLTITPGKKYTNTVTASTALPVTQIVGNTAIATVSNNVITILGAGSTTVTVSQAGNALYNPVTASQPLIVNKGSQTLAFTAIPTQTFSPFKTVTLKATSSAKLTNTSYLIDNGAIGTVSNNVLLLLGTGTATITATNSGNTYFAPAFATQKLIVH